MPAWRLLLRVATVLMLAISIVPLRAQQPAPSPAPPAAPPLFVVLFRTGPKWDAAKPLNEQAFMREHSENLRSLRSEGKIPMGGRFADVGLILVSAASEAEARAAFERDPSVKNGTFVFEVHPFRPFYTGCIGKAD